MPAGLVLPASPWVETCVQRYLQTRRPGLALDLACGEGRHARFLSLAGFQVLAVDKTTPGGELGDRTEFVLSDLETELWPLSGQCFDLVVVTNYLHRPHFDRVLDCVAEQGVLIYETFMQGNGQWGSPKNPDFLLRPNELLERCKGLNVLQFEQGLRQSPTPAMIQRVMAIRGDWSDIQSLSQLRI